MNDSGVLTNYGTLKDTGRIVVSGSISSMREHLVGFGSLTLDPGTMTNGDYVGVAVTLDGGSYLDNTATGTIKAAGDAVIGSGGPVSVANAGTIASTSGMGESIWRRAAA